MAELYTRKNGGALENIQSFFTAPFYGTLGRTNIANQGLSETLVLKLKEYGLLDRDVEQKNISISRKDNSIVLNAGKEFLYKVELREHEEQTLFTITYWEWHSPNGMQITLSPKYSEIFSWPELVTSGGRSKVPAREEFGDFSDLEQYILSYGRKISFKENMDKPFKDMGQLQLTKMVKDILEKNYIIKARNDFRLQLEQDKPTKRKYVFFVKPSAKTKQWLYGEVQVNNRMMKVENLQLY